MANRFYLYACREPREGEEPGSGITAVGESRLMLPHAFSVLCSAGPRLVDSVFFSYDDEDEEDEDEALAIESDFAEGLSTLMTFLDRLDSRLASATTIPEGVDGEQIRQQIQETREFFRDPRFDECTHFLLEGSEVYSLSGDPLRDEAERTLEEISDAESTITYVLEGMLPDEHVSPHSRQWYPESPQEIATWLGLDCWSRLVWLMTPQDVAAATDEAEPPAAPSPHEPDPAVPPRTPPAEQASAVPWWTRLLRALRP